MSGILELINALDSWGSPSDVFTAISGFLTGLLAGPVGLTISRLIQTKLGHKKCVGTNKELCKDKEKCDDHKEKDDVPL